MLGECLTELAKKYPQTKFVKIISTECIPSYPDKNVPTVLIYKDTKCLQHLIGLGPFGGPRTTPERESACMNSCLLALDLSDQKPACMLSCQRHRLRVMLFELTR